MKSGDPEHEVAPEELARARAGRLLTHKTLVYRAARRFFWFFFVLCSRYRRAGGPKLPASGACVIVANHQSYLDIPLVAVATRRHVCFVARDTLAKSRAIAFLIKHCGAVMVRRGSSDRAAIREILEHLERGDVVCIFPEGTRSEDGRVRPFQRGMALVARQAGAPIVPCGIRGTLAILPRGARLPRPARCSITFGTPLEPGADALECAREKVIALAGDGRFGAAPAPAESAQT
jgi:1-acyl-sn-glycerol-3-phosphate acyltransferase